MWSKIARVLRGLVQRKSVTIPSLPEPNVPGFDRNDIERLRAYDKELRMQALDLDIDILARREPQK